MKILKTYSFIVLLSFVLSSCGDEEKEMIDTEKPTIDLSIADAFPTSCDTIYFGESFTIKMLLEDNVELGAYNIDIHSNFDQHTHTTELENCTLDDVKTGVNPFVLIQDYTIPAGSSTYTTDASMTIPTIDGTGLYDEGDYHFQIRVTDKEGWSTVKGLNVKMLQK